MVNQVGLIDFTDYAEGIPAFICIAAMPFFYSISEGISMGVISYVVLNLVSGKAKEKEDQPGHVCTGSDVPAEICTDLNNVI